MGERKTLIKGVLCVIVSECASVCLGERARARQLFVHVCFSVCCVVVFVDWLCFFYVSLCLSVFVNM